MSNSNPLYGQNKFDSQLNNPDYVANKLAFMTGGYGHLALRLASETTDAATDTGFTLKNGQIAESLWNGDGAAASMVMPSATVGALTVFRFAAQADGGQNITFTCASTDTFHPGSICVPVASLGDPSPAFRKPAISTDGWIQSVATSTGAVKTITKGNNTFIISANVTNNQTAIGADLAFFCEKVGFWKISFIGSELGSGILNTTFATSTV